MYSEEKERQSYRDIDRQRQRDRYIDKERDTDIDTEKGNLSGNIIPNANSNSNANASANTNANKSFDTETKLRLIITLINDEGKEKLQNNIEKLVNRVIEYKSDYTNEIQRIFTNT